MSATLTGFILFMLFEFFFDKSLIDSEVQAAQTMIK